MKLRILLLLGLSLPAIAQCGGPTYPCALRQTNAQLTTIPLPNPIPSVGNLLGAGNSVVPQPYGSTVIRCTDAATDPTNTKLFSYEVTDTGGDNVYQWNSNQTMLRVIRMAASTTGVVPFDGKKCGPMIPGSVGDTGAQWSLNNPNVDYNYASGSQTKVNKRTFSGITPPVTTQIFDFANCPLLASLGTISFNTQITTNDDNLFLMAFGVNGQGQDTSQYVVAYRLDNGVCALLNTMTGIVQMAGTIPNVITIGQVSTFFPFTIHSAYLSPGGEFIIGVGTTCTGCPAQHGPFIWYPATTHLDFITVLSGGHSTTGFQNFLNVTAAPKIAERPLTNLANPVFISSNQNVKFPFPQDIHMGWQNDNSADTNPVCMSQMSISQPQPLVISTPLENEIFCVDFQNANTFIRLAPTLTSGIANQFNFRTQYAIMANGTKGFIAFSSDWMGNLGNTDGTTTTCTIGSNPPNMCRSDVFIVVPH